MIHSQRPRVRPAWGSRHRTGLLAALVSLLPSALVAQNDPAPADGNVPAEVQAMIASITAYRTGGSIPELGAGIVVGVGNDSVYIATALHVVIDREESVWVRFSFAPGDSIQASVRHESEDIRELDLAVITVPSAGLSLDALAAHEGRLGLPGLLHQGAEVSPVGCPDGECWGAPSPADRVLATGVEILFQSVFVKGGSSGGGLFDQDWEIVGMVTDSDPPRARAIPIDQILQQIRAWGVPVTLGPARIPRRGYATSVGFALLSPAYTEDGRAPSFRATLSRRVRRSFDAYVSILRLSPEDQGETCPAGNPDRVGCEALANALMIGGTGNFRHGRLGLRPFVEVGLAAAQGRWDAGGLFVANEYRPSWVNEDFTGLAFGFGASVEYILYPGLALEAIGGFWAMPDAFSEVDPAEELDADFPPTYFGIGVRFGR